MKPIYRDYHGTRPLQPFWFYTKIAKKRRKISPKKFIAHYLNKP